jgi:O-antigen ligase
MRSVAYVGLWIFIFSLPWEVVGSVGGVAVLVRLAGALALGMALLVVAVSGRFRRLHPFHVAAFLFVVWAGLDLLFFNSVPKLPSKYLKFVQLAMAVWMMWELAPTWPRLLGLLISYVCGAYVAAIDTLLLYRSASKLLRFTAGDTDPNDLAMTLALALPMAWYVGLTHRNTVVRWLCRGYVPLGILAIALTGSRGGMLTTVLALMIVPLTMGRLTPGKMAAAVCLLVVTGTLAVIYVPDKIVQRLSTTQAEVADQNFGNRGPIWRAGFHAFEHRPIVGYGTSGFMPAIMPEMGARTRVAHNSYLSVLVEQGMIGLFLFLIMFVTVYRAILHLPKLERRFALILLATLAIAILPLTWEDRKPLWFILAALVGLAKAWMTTAGKVARAYPPAPSRSAPEPRSAGRRLEPVPTPDTGADARS